ncbi:SMC family ATPase [Candidatus Bathyarchaeota archaeon]|nr:SMC family ATPase [Candidatus Bathyarchaeota archaeon]
MKIKAVHLENIRSHKKSVINFTDGFNCLVGGLGTGKSSVLYAIDFALFGEPLGRSYDYLLREGEDRARVILQFTVNGKEYAIIRALKRIGNRISQDMDQLRFFENGELVAELKSDAVLEQLFSSLGIDKNIFRRLIWIRQEHLKDVLNMTPGERQKTIDELFNLSDYENAWSNMRSVIRWYESEKSSLEKDPDVMQIKDLEARLSEAISEMRAKKIELEKVKANLLKVEAKLRESKARLEELENLRKRNEKLREQESRLQARISAAKESLRMLKMRIDEEFRRIEELRRLRNSLREQENLQRSRLKDVGVPGDLKIDELRKHLEDLREMISAELGKEETLRSEIKRASQRVSSIAEKSRCPLCLQNLSAEYKDRLIRQLRGEISENKRMLEEFEKKVRRLEATHNVLAEVISKIQTIEARIDNLREQEESAEKVLAETRRRVEEINVEISQLRAEIASVHSQMRKFDVSKIEKAQREHDIIFEEYAGLKSRAQSLEAQIVEISKRIDELKERLEAARKKVKRLDRVKRILEIAREIRQSYRSIQPKLRRDFILYLERTIQQILDELAGGDSSLQVRIDENYTPIVEGESGYRRNVQNLSGGERTMLAFAYRLGIAQLLMQWRTGRGLQLLLLDEPTESLGREDGSINRLAESLSRLKTVEQIIAVTHSEEFADKADHVIWLNKKDNQSIVSS